MHQGTGKVDFQVEGIAILVATGSNAVWFLCIWEAEKLFQWFKIVDSNLE